MFKKAFASPDYYILDFKCGIYEGEPIRWSYQDMVRGSVKRGGKTITFEECLLMDDNTTKLDLCYLHNEVFTDINCLYNLFIVKNKQELTKAKALEEDVLDLLNSDYGIMYKFVSFLKLVIEMIEQEFKPVAIEVLRDNLEYIKQFASHIVSFKVDVYLKRLIKIIKLDSIKKMRLALEKLVEDASTLLNKEVLKAP